MLDAQKQFLNMFSSVFKVVQTS